MAKHASNSNIKFADATTVFGLITNNDETAYRKQQREHPPIHIDGTSVEKVESFKVLCINITDTLKLSTHKDSVVKKAQQRPFNPRRLKKFGLSP